jgi:hypothetical protein
MIEREGELPANCCPNGPHMNRPKSRIIINFTVRPFGMEFDDNPFSGKSVSVLESA